MTPKSSKMAPLGSQGTPWALEGVMRLMRPTRCLKTDSGSNVVPKMTLKCPKTTPKSTKINHQCIKKGRVGGIGETRSAAPWPCDLVPSGNGVADAPPVVKIFQDLRIDLLLTPAPNAADPTSDSLNMPYASPFFFRRLFFDHILDFVFVSFGGQS